jgi:hypothetical protein
MGIIDYEGKSYELTPVDRDGYSCRKCDLYDKECAEIDPDALCFGTSGGQVLIFKEIPSQ